MLYPYSSNLHCVDYEHNMIVIDGGGWPRHATASCGDRNSTLGVLTGLVTGPFADYMRGDAKWSYRDNTIITDNPALRAERAFLFVKAGANPYMVAIDDNEYRETPHDYRWQWYTPESMKITGTGTTADPIVLTAEKGSCALAFITPQTPAVTISKIKNVERSRNHPRFLQRIDVSQHTTRAHYAAIATLQRNAKDRPAVKAMPVECENPAADGAEIRFADGTVDHIIWQPEEVYEQRGSDLTAGPLRTDALMALVRTKNDRILGYTLGEGTYLTWNGTPLVQAKSSVCVTADADGVKTTGRRRTREGFPTVAPVDLKTYKPAAR